MLVGIEARLDPESVSVAMVPFRARLQLVGHPAMVQLPYSSFYVGTQTLIFLIWMAPLLLWSENMTLSCGCRSRATIRLGLRQHLYFKNSIFRRRMQPGFVRTVVVICHRGKIFWEDAVFRWLGPIRREGAGCG